MSIEEDLNSLLEETISEESHEDYYEHEQTSPINQLEESRPTTRGIVFKESIIDLGKNKFATFLNILQILKNTCKDVYIKEGHIRQFPEKRYCIFDINIESLVKKTNLLMINISSKYDILETFRKQSVDMFLDINSKDYSFRDMMSTLKYIHPLEDHMSSKYIPDEDFSKFIQVDFDKRIFKYTLDKMMLERLMSASKSLMANILNFKFHNKLANIVILPSESSPTSVMELKTLEEELDDHTLSGVSALFSIQPIISFILGGVNEIEVELYHKKEGSRNDVYMKFSSSLTIKEENTNIIMNVWSPSNFSRF